LIPPGHWNANTVPPGDPRAVCARHQFSFNTCQGCHRDDTRNVGPLPAPIGFNTSFTHVQANDPPPVRMSKFLTGMGPGVTFNVADTQGLPIPNPPFAWPFGDLDRRWKRLFEIASCTSCLRIFPVVPAFIDRLALVPADIDPGDPPPFKIGPITDIGLVRELLDMRPQFAGEVGDE